MQAKAPFAIIIDSDPGVALSLRYLFTVICGLSCEVCLTKDEADALFDHSAAPEIVIVGRMAGRAALLAHLSAVLPSFLLAIDREESPQEAEDAFLAGADDVVRYPFSLRALALRLRARIGMLDTAQGRAILQDRSNWNSGAYIAQHANLTAAEAQIAHILMSRNGEIVTRDELSYAIDDRPWDYGDRKFDVHIAKIRKKLTQVFGAHVTVTTVRSVGYELRLDRAALEQLLAA
ncbi:winged helix-turn-helix domain-containing protein [Cognatishimia sp. SS12]|uniref:winged helix-turn-helix domain-containing protein n=1 Tax=Cognatishimia sp. SS12 TaxID=2979465 RepID=UPI00232FD287|nr:winged helix-turn-helix domain-containing protein [Cognatishimia sp. SS12]MDC0739452.1 winged helix-turn-helix domain-containing protein [Cognatishimia sp. SS12]